MDDLTFTVEPGVVTGFLGPDGSGKSTTMRLVLGLDAPTSGPGTVDGRPCAQQALAATHGISRPRVTTVRDRQDLLSPGEGLPVLAVWTAVSLAAAAVLLRHRDA